jgi:hypothetical protein
MYYFKKIASLCLSSDRCHPLHLPFRPGDLWLLRTESKMAHIPSHSPVLFHRCLYYSSHRSPPMVHVCRKRRELSENLPFRPGDSLLLRIESKMAHIPSHSPALFHRCLYLFITSITPRGSFMQEEKRVKRKSQNERRQRGG